MSGKEKNGEEKKYTVVDRRWALDEQALVEETTEASDTAEEPVTTTETQDDGIFAERTQEADHDRDPRVEDAIRVVFGAIREQALGALGLLISKDRRTEPDMDRATAITKIFSSLADRFVGRLADIGLVETDRPEPSLEEVVAFCINVMQGQVYIRMGLIANPATGLLSKDLEQAKLGVDFCDALMEQVRPFLSAAVSKQIEGAVADMKLNFVNQCR